MAHREELLAAAQGSSFAEFIRIGDRHRATTDSFKLEEVLDGMSHAETKPLWEGVCSKISRVIQSQEHLSQQPCPALSVLRTATLLINTFIEDIKRKTSPPLLTALTALHDIILALQGDMGKTVQNEIAKACELWWSQERSGKENLVVQTVSLLLVRSLASDVKAADVKRLYNFRTSLLLIDYTDPAASSIRQLLANTLAQAVFLKCDEGRKFCSYLFGLHPHFVQNLHDAIKEQIPTSKKAALEHYGEVYFRAWKGASGPYLIRIENCVQELMDHAIHAGTPYMARALRTVLQGFTTQKKQAKVDELLMRLYEPLLWRSFAAPNHAVRKNAATLLVDAFPLQDPDAPTADIDAKLQKQFDVLSQLLDDPAVAVRSVAVEGVCRILNVFWTVIPVPTVKAFMNRIIKQLSKDSASPAIRAAVLDGVAVLLDNPLSQPALKLYMSDIGHLINDTSEKVRCAMLDVLLRVKLIRTIRFWDVVPVDTLLARLAVDSSRVKGKITELLLESYFPTDKPSAVQVTRGVRLMRGNPVAAAAFYGHVHQFANTPDVCSLAERFHNVLSRVAEAPVGASVSLTSEDVSAPAAANPKKAKKTKGGKKGKQTEDDGEPMEEQPASSAASDSSVSSNDVAIIESILNTIAILWQSVAAKLEKPRHAAVKNQMIEIFSGEALAAFVDRFSSATAISAILSIASHLPPMDVPVVRDATLPRLSALPDNAPESEYGPLVDCLCAWGMTESLVDVVCNSLSTEILAEAASTSRGRKAARPNNKAKSAAVELQHCSPSLAMNILQRILAVDANRTVLIADAALVSRVAAASAFCRGQIEERFANDKAGSITDHVLTTMINIHGRLCIHQAVRAKQADAAEHLVSLIEWANTTLLPRAVAVAVVAVEAPAKGRKRRAAESTDKSTSAVAQDTLESVLMVATEALTVGLWTTMLTNTITSLVKAIVSSQHTALITQTLPHCVKVFYQLLQKGTAAQSSLTLLGQLLTNLPEELVANLAPVLAEAVTLMSGAGLIEQIFQIVLVPALNSLPDAATTHLPIQEDVPAHAALAAVVFSRPSDTVANVANYLTDRATTVRDLTELWQLVQMISVLHTTALSRAANKVGGPSVVKPAGAAHLVDALFTVGARINEHRGVDEIKNAVSSLRTQLEASAGAGAA